MKCENCGMEMEEGKLKCELCGKENKPAVKNPKRKYKSKPKSDEDAIAIGKKLLEEDCNEISEIRRAYRHCPKGDVKLLLFQKMKQLEVEKFIGKGEREKMETKPKAEETKKEEAKKPEQAKKTFTKEIVEVNDGMVFKVIDMLDEKEIGRALSQGIVSEKWCYHFKMGGRDIYGIGFEGAKQLAIITGGVCIDASHPPVVLSEDNIRMRVGAYGGLVRNGVIVFGIWGVAEQCKWFAPNHRNEKAFVVACSKAQRNAILSLIPETVRTKAIELWKKEGKVHTIDEAEFKQNNPVVEKDDGIRFGE